MYNVGLNIVRGMMKHVIVKFPYNEKGIDIRRIEFRKNLVFHKISCSFFTTLIFSGNMFKMAEVVHTIEPRWRFNPSYMHAFGK